MKNGQFVLVCIAAALVAGCSSSGDTGAVDKNQAVTPPAAGQGSSGNTNATPTTSDQELTLNPNAENVTPGSKLGGN